MSYLPLLVQDALKNKTETIFSLQEKYGLKVNRHPDHPELVQLKYDSIDSNLDHVLVRQCRGLILDESSNWRCIARPIDKFFNMGESRADKIDWATSTIHEKLDGTMMILYAHVGLWRVATIGRANADGNVNGSEITFRELFWDVWREMKYVLPANQCLTFMFELMTPLNKVVVDYPERSLKLIAVRDRDTGYERPTAFFTQYHAAHKFKMNSMSDLIKSFEGLKGTEMEGYVVQDGSFNRIKVKHPEYVQLHHLRDNFHPKGILDIVRRGEGDEIAAYFPEWRSTIGAVSHALDTLNNEIEAVYLINASIESQKDFAMEIVGLPYSGILFFLRAGKIPSVRYGLATFPLDKIAELIELDKIVLPPSAGTGSPKPDHGEETQKNMEALAKAEAFLRERGFTHTLYPAASDIFRD